MQGQQAPSEKACCMHLEEEDVSNDEDQESDGLKKPAVHLAHLEEEDAGNDEDQESDNPSRIEGVIEEFMVCLARAVKDAHRDEKCCYHCSSLEHFIYNCPLVKTSRERNS